MRGRQEEEVSAALGARAEGGGDQNTGESGLLGALRAGRAPLPSFHHCQLHRGNPWHPHYSHSVWSHTVQI